MLTYSQQYQIHEKPVLAPTTANSQQTQKQEQQKRQPQGPPAQAKATPPIAPKLIHPPLLDTARPKRYTGLSCVPRPRVRPRQQFSKQPASNNHQPPANTWYQLQKRPYLQASDRDGIAHGTKQYTPQADDLTNGPLVYHVDFTDEEISKIIDIVGKKLPQPLPRTRVGLKQIVGDPRIPLHVEGAIKGRTSLDIYNLCCDIAADKASRPNQLQILSLDKTVPEHRHRHRHSTRLPSLLMARELEGNIGFGRMRQYANFQNEFRTCYEDRLSVIAEFTNCAGDISAMSWVPGGNVICGTTTHSDAHNQQYNKPGNLLLCSTKQGKLRAFADHRIPRPVIEKGENSTLAMRESQDPWLYSSVVSTDYDETNGRAFTSSFDKTVKVWNVADDGTSMEALATWPHQGNVNFVAAAKDGSGCVATAADVSTRAVRIYTINANNVQSSEYETVSCTRTDADGSDKWGYFPATMQWGRAPGTHHLLAIGYSPRSFSSDDSDIPEDKLHSGEIVLWDARRRCQVPVLTATTANVFEVTWHPTLPRFIAATSPSGPLVEQGIRTQVHMFQQDRERADGAYNEFQKLDCPASDVNELTIMPNSLRHAYITAGCTDGRVYVWDTAQGDHPIHVLKHGYPLDDFASDREKEDTGIKFTAWGSTFDRFYTGSSDGVVKVWNVRCKPRPFVRDLLEAPGPISCGKFSPDGSKLVVGDATGRVFFLSVDERDEIPSHFTTVPGTNRRLRRPQPFTPHPEPGPPVAPESRPRPDRTIATYARQKYIMSKQVILHPNPVIGAVQGPMYLFSGPIRADAHFFMDPEGPLLPEFERHQQSTIHASLGPRCRSIRRLKDPGVDMAEDAAAQAPRGVLHRANVGRDLDVACLDDDVMAELVSCGAQLSLEGEEGWELAYEELPEGM